MAQLSEDSFAFPGGLMPVGDALALIAARVTPIAEAETVPLAQGDGRILAGDVMASVDLPPFDNSAVDGYAVRFADLPPGTAARFAVVGRAVAGAPPLPAPEPGTAVRIFTGAVMPQGTDTVFMQEDVSIDADGHALLPAGLARGANRRLAGEDIRRGARALAAGRRLVPQDIGLLAALGETTVAVRRRLRVAVFSTGDEIRDPGTPLKPGHIYDANRFMLAALLRRLPVEVSDLGILPDDRAALARALSAAAAAHDLIVTTGGVSTGDEDHVKAAVESSGSLTFWRLAIKPGRPLAMGIVQGTALVGLPGNPVATFVTFAHVLRPLVLRLAGGTAEALPSLPVRSAFAYSKKAGRREYVRVRLVAGTDGAMIAHKHEREGAGVITSLTETDGLAELAESVTRVAPGDVVGFYPYALLR